MKVFILAGVTIGVIVTVLYFWPSSSDHMELTFPINIEDKEQLYQLIKDKRFRSSIEEFPISFEIIKDENCSAYIDLLLNQYKNSDKSMHDFIERIPFTEASQQFFSSLSVGWHSSFSITLIGHKKFNGYHKIIIASLSKKVNVSLAERILSPRRLILGMTISEQKQMEAILKSMNQEHSKQTMENTMMYIMADNIRSRFNDHVDIKFIEGNKTEL